MVMHQLAVLLNTLPYTTLCRSSSDLPAHVVDIVGIVVVGRAHGDDGAQTFWLAGSNLQPVESAPGDAHNPGTTAAPGLCCQPGQDLFDVLEFLFQIFIGQHTV